MKTEEYYCKRCDAKWSAPDRSETDWWHCLASKRKGIVPAMGAIQWMRMETNFSPWEIKMTVSHQLNELNECPHCGAEIRNEGIAECFKCGGLNFIFR